MQAHALGRLGSEAGARFSALGQAVTGCSCSAASRWGSAGSPIGAPANGSTSVPHCAAAGAASAAGLPAPLDACVSLGLVPPPRPPFGVAGRLDSEPLSSLPKLALVSFQRFEHSCSSSVRRLFMVSILVVALCASSAAVFSLAACWVRLR